MKPAPSNFRQTVAAWYAFSFTPKAVAGWALRNLFPLESKVRMCWFTARNVPPGLSTR